MKHLLSALFLIFLSFITASAKDFKLSGKLQRDDKQSADYINVCVMTVDSLTTTASLTSPGGAFMWKGLPQGRYIFRVNSPDFQPVSFLIDWNNDRNVNLGAIRLSVKDTEKTIELSEVTVQGSHIIQKVDKMIVFPRAEQVKISSGSMDLLQVLSLPGMSVNAIEQRATIDGQAPVYQINGRPQSREQVLGVKPDEIARIEYSNNPSIRYANQGVGGVINFILKERQTGGNVYVNAMASPMTGFLNGTLSNSFNYKKSEFTLLYNNSWRDYTKRWTDRTEAFAGEERRIERVSNGLHSPFGYLSQDINLGYALQINERSMFSATFLNNIGRQHTSINANIRQTEKDQAIDFVRNSKAVFEVYSPSLDLFFIQKFKKEQSLELNVVGTLASSDYDRNLLDRYESKPEQLIANKVANNRKSLIGEATYRKSFKSQSLSASVRHVQSYTKNDYAGNTTEETRMTSGNTYFYGEWSGRVKKLSYSLGTGVKLYTVDDRTDKRSYTRNLTTVSLLYPLWKDMKVSYLFQLTPTLPSLSQLSNVEQAYEDLLIIKGNPQLEAYNTIRNRFLFTYTKKKLKANLWVSHTKAINPISMYTFYDTNRGEFLSEYKNQDYNQQTNVQLDVNLSRLFNCMNLSVTGGWNRYASSGVGYKHALHNLYWSASMQGYYKNWNLSYAYTRPQKSLVGEIINLSENYSSALVGYNTGQFQFKAGVYYPFTRAWKSETTSLSKANPYHEAVRIKDNGNMLVVGVTYQLRYGKSLNKARKNLNNADNEIGILKVQE